MAGPIGNMVIRVDLDGSGFNKGIAGLNRQMRLVSKEMSANLSKFGRYDSSLEKSRVKVDGLTKKQQVQAQKVRELKNNYDQLSKETGENSAKTQAAAAKYNQAYAELNKYERELSEASSEMQRLEKQQRILNTSMGKIGSKLSQWGPKFQEIGRSMQSIGKSMSLHVTAPVVAGLGAAAKKSIDFDDSMRKVKATSGATSGEFQQLRDKALEMGAKTKFSASQSAEALNYMALAGWDTKDMLNGVDGVMQLAAASGEDLGAVSDIVTDSLTAFGLKAKDSGHFADVLAQTSSKANTDVRGMGEAFKYAAPVAGALGYTVEDTSIAIGLMSNAGIKGEKAGTALRTMFTNLAKPTKAMKNEMEKLGISITDSKGNMLPMRDVMDQLRGKFKGLSKDQQASAAATIFGKEAMSGALAVINASDEDYKKLTKSIDNSSGASKRMADEMEGGIGGSFRKLKSAIESLAISIGDVLAPYLKHMADWLSKVTAKLNAMPKGTQKVVVGIGLVAAAIGPLLVTMGVMVSTIGASLKVLGPLFTGLGRLTLLTRGANGQIKLFTLTQKVWNGVVKTSKNIADAYRFAIAKLSTSQTIAAIKTKVSAAATKLWTVTTKAAALATRGLGLALRFMTGPIGIAITAVAGLVAAVVHLWKTNANFRNAVINIWDSIKSAAVKIFNGIKSAIVTSFTIAKALSIKIWLALKNAVINLARGLWNGVKNIFNSLSIFTHNIFNSIKNFSLRIWTSIKNTVIGLARGLWHGIKAVFNTLYNWTRFLFKAYLNYMRNSWLIIRNTVVRIARSLWHGVKAIWNSLYNGTRSIFNRLKSWVSNLWSSLKNRVVNIASSLWSNVKRIFNNLYYGIRKIFYRVKSTMVNIWDSIKRSVTGIASSLWNSVRRTFTNMKNGLKSIIDKIKGHINGMVNAVKKGLNKLIDGVNWVAGKIGMDKLPKMKLHTGTTSTHTQRFITNGKINRDTFATVGDRGRGNGPGGFRHEMIRYPNGKMALTPNRDTTAFLPKGSAVFNGAQTHAMLSGVNKLPKFSTGTMFDLLGRGKKPKKHKHGDEIVGDVIGNTKKAVGNVGRNANAIKGKILNTGKSFVSKALETAGKGKDWLAKSVGDVLDWIEKPGKLLSKVLDGFGINFDFLKGAELPYKMMKAMFKKLKDATVKLFTDWLEDAGGGDGGFIDLSKGINFGFAPTAAAAARAGYPFPRPHFGLDINYKHDKVYSTMSGTARTFRGWSGGFGNHVEITNGSLKSIYGHLHKLAFSGTKQVHPGTYLGISGGDPREDGAGAGSSTGLHLHYEMQRNGVPFDPTSWLKKHNGGGRKSGNYPKGSGRAYASRVIKQAQNILGGPYKSSYVHDQMMRLVKRESNFQPDAVNDWDINAQRGTPSKGLFQMIKPTFDYYAKPGYRNFNNPLHQAISSMRNIFKKYGPIYGFNGAFKRAADYAYATGGKVYNGLYHLGEEGYPEWIIPTDPSRASDAAKLLALASKDISKNKRPKNFNSGSIGNDDTRNSKLESKLDTMIGLLIKLVGSNDAIADKDFSPVIDNFGLSDFINSTVDKRERNNSRRSRFKPGGALI